MQNYSERIDNIKKEMLKEISDILGVGNSYEFADPFYVHFIEGEVATTEVLHNVALSNNGVLGFWLQEEMSEEGRLSFVEGDTLLMYDTSSLIDVLENIKKELQLRTKKLEELRALVISAGCMICFTDDFLYDGIDKGQFIKDNQLISIQISPTNELTFHSLWEGNTYDNNEDFPTLKSLSRIIEKAKERIPRYFRAFPPVDEKKDESVGFRWIADNSDFSFKDESDTFKTIKECYEDMRLSALRKMMWNTDINDDALNEGDVVVNNQVVFSKYHIVLESDSERYIYRIVRADAIVD